MPETTPINRRRFLQASASASVFSLASAAAREVAIVSDPADPVANTGPVQWALKELENSLSARSIPVRRFARVAAAPVQALVIGAAGSAFAQRRDISSSPESLALIPERVAGRNVLFAYGSDARGLMYAILDLADRVQNAADPVNALALEKPVFEHAANRVRSIARLFTSEVEDKPWYNDREMWPAYLTMLAAQRFNRFNLSFGIGYDFLTNVTDAYFLFAYPFLISVPGYNVRVPQLADAERDRNLAMLRYISEQTAARGLHFQLGLWMHGYQWLKSPNPNYTIEGLTPGTHGPYCRDAVRAVLKACPAIGGVTFRIHGESGVEEGSYSFWKTVFEGVATCGRPVEIDMHAKGMDQAMLDLAVAAGMPLKVSPKYWAEHLGMPYHQAEIRDQERPRPDKPATGLMKFSAGSRSFLRYGYGDLLREPRKWGVLTRIWPGTQRLLVWGDPLTAAAHSRAFSFCGSDGVEICEPLSFKGRRGSGIPGDRSAYADTTLRPRWDWQKYAYTYRVWGRHLFNPATEADGWQRYLRRQFGANGLALGDALANASRILPIVTTAYDPSAANNSYWPELYFNQSIVDAEHYQPYSDTPAPRVFGNAGPLDPQLFSRMNEYADELLKDEHSGKYSPIEVAQWIEDYAAAAARSLAVAETHSIAKGQAEYRRLAIDVAIQAGLGRFFGAKFRAGVLYHIYEQTEDRSALEQALKCYRQARAAWAELADRATGVYLADITVGEHPQLRGHWLDRIPAMDADIELLVKRLDSARSTDSDGRVLKAIENALARPDRAKMECRHVAPARFRRGAPLEINLWAERPVAAVRLVYRHVNQVDRYENLNMAAQGNRYRATIPAAYTDSEYPLQYYFEVRHRPGVSTLYPGFAADLNNQPYFVVQSAIRNS